MPHAGLQLVNDVSPVALYVQDAVCGASRPRGVQSEVCRGDVDPGGLRPEELPCDIGSAEYQAAIVLSQVRRPLVRAQGSPHGAREIMPDAVNVLVDDVAAGFHVDRSGWHPGRVRTLGMRPVS